MPKMPKLSKMPKIYFCSDRLDGIDGLERQMVWNVPVKQKTKRFNGINLDRFNL
jgi:hypothetical protein